MPRPGEAGGSGHPELTIRPRIGDEPQWVVEDEVMLSVDGSRVWNADRGQPEPAVVMRMPAHYARHLAAVLDDWSTIGRLLESARGAEERELAAALHAAARAAEDMSAPRNASG
jgi:hypothetical protein